MSFSRLRFHFFNLSLVILVSLFGASTSAFAQSPAPRDASASATVQAAVVALGGSSLQGVDNCVAQGQVTRNGSVGAFKWETSGTDFHYEETVDSVTSLVVSNQGTPTNVIGSQVTYFPFHFAVALFPRPLIGLKLAQYLSDSTVSFTMASSTPATSTGGFRVEVTFPQHRDALVRKIQQEWTIDARTGLPSQIHQWVPGYPIANFIRESDTYLSNYKVLGGVLIPSHVDEYTGNTLLNSYDVSSLQCGVTIDPSDFTVIAVAQAGAQ